LLTDFTSNRCNLCQRHEYHFDFALSACLYEKPLTDIIHQFKYQGRTYWRFCLSQLMIDFIHRHQIDIAQFSLVTPIPLHPSRQRERGYNQAAMLGTLIAKHFSIPFVPKLLQRKRNTHSQTALEEKERWTNVRSAFTINHSQMIFGQSVLVVDDLLTTGATASSAAYTLKQHGAKRVGILSLAITP
jgi:ComF family protein